MSGRSLIVPTLVIACAVAAPAFGAAVHLKSANLATQGLNGKALFKEKCVMCHGPSGMGTGLLARRTQPAMLTKRSDLSVEFVMQAARTGIGNMPALTRGEVSDPQLKAIAEYLSHGPYGTTPTNTKPAGKPEVKPEKKG